MKSIVILLFTFVFLHSDRLKAQTKTAKKYLGTPFQGTKHYCSAFKPVQYDVTIKGTKVLIIYAYKDFTKKVKGAFIKGKVFTDDPNETGSKGYEGRYYKISKDFLAINSLEGGDYVEYALCR
jgi:hypothetical protein